MYTNIDQLIQLFIRMVLRIISFLDIVRKKKWKILFNIKGTIYTKANRGTTWYNDYKFLMVSVYSLLGNIQTQAV